MDQSNYQSGRRWYKNHYSRHIEAYHNVSKEIRDQLDAEAETVQIILTGIYNEIYSIVNACLNTCEMWKAIERLKQGESINVQDLETNLYWEFGKFTSWDGESLESYYSRSQQAATKNRGKAIVNSPQPTYDQEPAMVAEDDEMSKEKDIDKLMALISLSFKKIYKPTNNNLRTSSNTSRANQVNTSRINKGTGYDNQRAVNVVGARETVGTKLTAEQVDWRDNTDGEPDDQELEAHYLYMAQIQEVTPDAADNSGPIFDAAAIVKAQVIILFIVDSGCSKHMTGNLKLLSNFVEKFLGTVKFRNDQIAPILGYEDLVQGNITIKRVYYVKGLNYNLFSVGQFCDADLEVAFRKSICYIRDLKGNDLLTGGLVLTGGEHWFGVWWVYGVVYCKIGQWLIIDELKLELFVVVICGWCRMLISCRFWLSVWSGGGSGLSRTVLVLDVC
ncbi:hypothetical protein Tco_0798402 [Tanacetum coccineum]